MIIKKIFFIFLTAGGLILIFLQLNKTQQDKVQFAPTAGPILIENESVDYKATLAIFTNGTFRVFTNAMYHNLSPDVFIQADNPNQVNVKKRGLTWGQFFATLPFKLSKDCLTTGTGETFCSKGANSLKFYLNGQKSDDLLQKEIKENDKVLVNFGSGSEEEIQNQHLKLNEINEK